LQKSLLSYAPGHTLQFVGGHNTIRQTRSTTAQQGVCCYAGRRIYSQLHIAISPYPADGILSAFVVIFIISFSIGCGSGLDIIKYQHSSKLWPLGVMLRDSLRFDEKIDYSFLFFKFDT
jgi:hypothetical protein